MSDLRDFRLFCEQASDRQLIGIIEREGEAAESGDLFRIACLEIAIAVEAGRA